MEKKTNDKTEQFEPRFIPKESEQIDLQINKLTISKKDVILLKGSWDNNSIDYLLHNLNEKGHDNIVVVLNNGLDIESMGIQQFYDLMKTLKDKLDSE